MHWQTSRRKISLTQPIVMGILNVTPDSFSDGGEFLSADDALRRAERMILGGADIIDIGGESTRPSSERVDAATEMRRTLPVVAAIAKRFDTPISIDTSRSEVAAAAVEQGAEIINDISGLRWDPFIADIAARTGAGLVLMHSRGIFETMHSEPPVDDILREVIHGFIASIRVAKDRGVADEHLALDIGVGFGKTFRQNLELLAKLDTIVAEFEDYPMLVGASRKSFIGRILDDAPVSKRLGGSIAAALVAVKNGATIVRVHDVTETVAALRTLSAIGDGVGSDEDR
ncbi:MAG: dihydropteroate synthase [Pyrinomonadaceae bacterium]